LMPGVGRARHRNEGGKPSRQVSDSLWTWSVLAAIAGHRSDQIRDHRKAHQTCDQTKRYTTHELKWDADVGVCDNVMKPTQSVRGYVQLTRMLPQSVPSGTCPHATLKSHSIRHQARVMQLPNCADNGLSA